MNTYENSIQIAGQTQHHAYYTSAGVFHGSSSTDPTHIIRASQLFKGNFSLSGTQTNTSDPAEYYNHEYTTQGFVKVDQKQNWLQKTFAYDTRERLTSVTDQNGFQTLTTYYGNSNLVQRKTNIDGTYIDFEYDGLLRLKKETSQPSGVYTEYSYSYYTSTVPNSIKIKTTYHTTTVTGSNLTNIENINYTDKLGRTIAKVAIKASPSQKDVITCYEYDNQGRLIKEFLPVETANSDGTYVAPLGTWKYKETKYEASPLSRVTETIPPDWYATKYEYGMNISTDNINNQAGGTYAVNKLIKETVIDGNGNRSIKFTDLKGRVICERKTDASDTPTKRRDTYTHYDNKGRVTTVIPPDASTSTTELIYQYTYDDENKLMTKKIPGKGIVTFGYNNKDLIASEKDAIQDAKSPKEWIVYNYDSNGRQLKSGLFIGTAGTTPNLDNPTFSTVYTENIYGTTGIEKDKIKTYKVNVLGTSNNLQTTYTYDTRGRIQSYSANNVHNISTFNTTSFTYDNGNNILSKTEPLSVTIGGSTSGYDIINSYTYDHQSRTIDENFAYNGGTTKTIATNVYNYRSELTRIRQGKHNTTIYLQDIDYSYRSNGLLEKINDYLGTVTTGDLFYMQYYYDNPVTGSLRKNGEISNIKWQRRNSTLVGGLHAYSYNEFGELKGNDYSTITGATTFAASNNYDETFDYDKFGRTTVMTRKNNAGATIDNLAYFYINNGLNPRTSHINDLNNNTAGHNQNGQSSTPIQPIYEYDANGNQKKDPYRGVTNINYNFLDLAVLIDFGGGKKVEMTYDATGNMLTKKVYNTGAVLLENRTYNKGREFVAYGTGNQAIENIHHSQGFYKPSVSRHFYTLKDHLGNIRIVYTDANNDGVIAQSSTEIIDENHYYAYGMEMSDAGWYNSTGNGAYAYKFNGIERTESIGLNIDLTLYRGLDPVLGKWYQVDPKAEIMTNMSPFCAMNNNPISFADPNGDIPFFIIPQFGYSKSGGLSLGVEVGIGVPGLLSASVTGGYNFGSSQGYWSVQGYAAGFYAGYGSSGGFAGWGYRYAGLSGGVTYNSGGWGVGISYGGTNGNFNGSVGIGWSQNGSWDWNVSGGYTYFKLPSVKFDPKGLPQDGDFQVDQDLCEINIEPYEVPPYEISSVNAIEKAAGIQKLLKIVSKPSKIKLIKGKSEYNEETGLLSMGSNDFTSWRRLTSAYGHELVHRYTAINFTSKFEKFQLPKAFTESMAHHWSHKYSGIDNNAYAFWHSKMTKSSLDLFDKNKIYP